MGIQDWFGLGGCAGPCSGNTIDEDLMVEYPKNATPLYRAIERRQWASVNTFLKTGCWKNSYFADSVSPKEQVRTWVVKYEEFSDQVNLKRVSWKQLPIHAAIIFTAPAIIVQKLMNLYPQALRCGDNRGNLPIHLGFRHGSNDAILAILLQEYPESMNCRESNGLLPTECSTELPSPQPLRGALLKTALKKPLGEGAMADAESKLTDKVVDAEAFVVDEQKDEPSYSNVTEPSKEGEGKHQLSELSRQMEELKTTVHEAFSKGSHSEGKGKEKEFSEENKSAQANDIKKSVDPLALESLREMVSRALAGATETLQSSTQQSGQQQVQPTTPHLANKPSLSHNMSYPANSILVSEQGLQTFSSNATPLESNATSKKTVADENEVKKLQEKMSHMELAMKEMHNREKTVRRELAMTLKEVKRWKQQAKKATAEEEKNRILTEMLHELVPSSKKAKVMKSAKTSPKKQKQKHLFRETVQDDDMMIDDNDRHAAINGCYSNMPRYYSSPRALRKTRSEIPTPTFLHGDDNETLEDTVDEIDDVIEYRQAPAVGRRHPRSARHADERDYFVREGPPAPKLTSPKRKSNSDHGRIVHYEDGDIVEEELVAVAKSHLRRGKQEPSPRGKQCTKSNNKSFPKHNPAQTQETFRVEPTAIRAVPCYQHYQDCAKDPSMDPRGTRLETYYRPPARTMSQGDTATQFSMSLTEAAMASQENYRQQKKSRDKGKKRGNVEQYYIQAARRGRDPALDPEVDVGSPVKSYTGGKDGRSRNNGNNSSNSTQYTDDSSYPDTMESGISYY